MDGETALLVDHGMPGVRAAMTADNEIGVTREQVDDLALALVAPMPADDRSYRHRATLPSRRILIRVRGSAARPPGANRCSARASLRTPSRPHPPLNMLAVSSDTDLVGLSCETGAVSVISFVILLVSGARLNGTPPLGALGVPRDGGLQAIAKTPLGLP